MNFIKFLLIALGLIFGAMLLFWLVGIVSSLLWYGLWLGLIGAVVYGGYKLFTKLESKVLGSGTADELPEARDFNMTWEEYDRKYLHK